jgi:hypothetical protein
MHLRGLTTSRIHATSRRSLCTLSVMGRTKIKTVHVTSSVVIAEEFKTFSVFLACCKKQHSLKGVKFRDIIYTSHVPRHIKWHWRGLKEDKMSHI